MPRILDFFLAIIAILALSPLLFLLWLSAAASTGSSGIFKQKRIGQYGELFEIYKFRTMVADKPVTCGKFLRKYKLDELPQLINVISGKMAIVGPRPDVAGYYDKLAGSERLLLNLKPGLTSPAALKFRNEEYLLSLQLEPERYNDEVIFPEKVQLNLEYFENKSFLYDCKVIFQTIFVIATTHK